MTRRLRLSDRAVARLGAASSEYSVWDTRITGLGVRVRPSGHRSFVLLDNHNCSSKRRSLGPVTHMTVDEARSRCLAIQTGDTDILPDRPLAPVPLFGDFVSDVWISECFDRLKTNTRRSVNSALANQLLPAFGGMPLDRIGRKEVMAWFDRYSGVAPGGANRALDTLRQILNHAMVHGHIETNPASGVRPNPKRRFNRFLSRDEARCLHAELDRLVAERPERAAQADIIRLLYCTGCRCSEIRTLRWCDPQGHPREHREHRVTRHFPSREFLTLSDRCAACQRPCCAVSMTVKHGSCIDQELHFRKNTILNI